LKKEISLHIVTVSHKKKVENTLGIIRLLAHSRNYNIHKRQHITGPAASIFNPQKETHVTSVGDETYR
jgi:hypothetical protein